MFTLEPGKLYRIDAEVVRFPEGEGLERRRRHLRDSDLGQAGAGGPGATVVAAGHDPQGTPQEEWDDHRWEIQAYAQVDFQVPWSSNATLSLNASTAVDAASGRDFSAGSIVGPFAFDKPPDDVWSQCADFVGAVPQFSMVGVFTVQPPDNFRTFANEMPAAGGVATTSLWSNVILPGGSGVGPRRPLRQREQRDHWQLPGWQLALVR